MKQYGLKIGKTAVEYSLFVASGEVAIGRENDWLRSTPLGSCVAIVAYDVEKKVGGMAHIMLPGKSLFVDNPVISLKYAFDAIEYLAELLETQGVDIKKLPLCIVGGSNVLKSRSDTIALEVANSVLKIIADKKLEVYAVLLGGYERHTVSLEVKTGTVYYTSGDGPDKVLSVY